MSPLHPKKPHEKAEEPAKKAPEPAPAPSLMVCPVDGAASPPGPCPVCGYVLGEVSDG